MKKLLWLLFPLWLWSCQNEASSDGSGRADGSSVTTVSETGDSLPNPAAATQAAKASESTDGAKEKVEPIIGTRTPQPPADFAGSLTLTSEQVSAATGENVCLKVRVGDFREVITMQYSLAWDPKVLSFTGIRDLNLPYLANNNFGTHRTGEGILTFVWIDNSLKGVNLPDGSSIYQVCFDVKGKTGQKSDFRITDQPTPFESVNAGEKLLRIVPGQGEVRVN